MVYLDKAIEFLVVHAWSVAEIVGALMLAIIGLYFFMTLGKEQAKEAAIKAGANITDIEALMHRMLGETGKPTMKTASEAADIIKDNEPAVDTSKLEAELAIRDKKIAELEKLLKEKGGASGGGDEETKKKLAELEKKLSDYAIIEDDIANLNIYKEENTRLKEEIEKLKAGGATAEASTDPDDPLAAANEALKAAESGEAPAEGAAAPEEEKKAEADAGVTEVSEEEAAKAAKEKEEKEKAEAEAKAKAEKEAAEKADGEAKVTEEEAAKAAKEKEEKEKAEAEAKAEAKAKAEKEAAEKAEGEAKVSEEEAAKAAKEKEEKEKAEAEAKAAKEKEEKEKAEAAQAESPEAEGDEVDEDLEKQLAEEEASEKKADASDGTPQALKPKVDPTKLLQEFDELVAKDKQLTEGGEESDTQKKGENLINEFEDYMKGAS